MSSVLASVSASTVAVAALAYIFRTWLSERLRQSIAHEYQIALERLRADNARLNAAQATTNSALAEIHRAAHERRLDAIEKLWSAINEMRSKIPTSVFWYTDLLAPTEYQEFLIKPDFMRDVATLDAARHYREFGSIFSDVDRSRPFIGDALFGLFFIYRATHFRLCHLLADGRDNGNIPDWHKDSGIEQLLSAVLSKEETAALLGKMFFTDARAFLEARILQQANRIISGEASAAFTLEQTQKIAEVMAKKWDVDAARPA